jgi:hypothetical protein
MPVMQPSQAATPWADTSTPSQSLWGNLYKRAISALGLDDPQTQVMTAATPAAMVAYPAGQAARAGAQFMSGMTPARVLDPNMSLEDKMILQLGQRIQQAMEEHGPDWLAKLAGHR